MKTKGGPKIPDDFHSHNCHVEKKVGTEQNKTSVTDLYFPWSQITEVTKGCFNLAYLY